MTTTEILMFLLDSLPDSVSVSIRLIRKISNRENKWLLFVIRKNVFGISYNQIIIYPFFRFTWLKMDMS